MPEDTIEDRIARRVVEFLKREKFKIEAKRWPEIFDLATAAEYMCRSEAGVRNLIRTGQIPSVRGDARMHIRKADIDTWAARSVERL